MEINEILSKLHEAGIVPCVSINSYQTERIVEKDDEYDLYFFGEMEKLVQEMNDSETRIRYFAQNPKFRFALKLINLETLDVRSLISIIYMVKNASVKTICEELLIWHNRTCRREEFRIKTRFENIFDEQNYLEMIDGIRRCLAIEIDIAAIRNSKSNIKIINEKREQEELEALQRLTWCEEMSKRIINVYKSHLQYTDTAAESISRVENLLKEVIGCKNEIKLKLILTEEHMKDLKKLNSLVEDYHEMISDMKILNPYFNKDYPYEKLKKAVGELNRELSFFNVI